MQDDTQEQTGKGDALSACSILVTRPQEQAESLCQMIEAVGGHAIRFPVIAIMPAKDVAGIQQLIQRLADFDLAIFISANAVRFAMQQFPLQRPPDLKFAAIGKATASALAEYGVSVEISPDAAFNSESLLSMAPMQDLAGKKIILFKGEGGRQLLADTLIKRGAIVSEANVYRRTIPDVDSEPLIHAWSNGEVNVVTVTSQEGLYNLDTMLGSKGQSLLQQTPMVVISERMLEVTSELGIHSPVIVAKHASDEAIVAAIIELTNMHHFKGQ